MLEVEVGMAEVEEVGLASERCSGRKEVSRQSRSQKRLPSSTTFESPG